MAAVLRRWRCLEVGCGTVITGETDEELVEAANAHVQAAHDSYELEEVILAGAEDVNSDAAMNQATDGSHR